jgi:class 3 adenylate cyclase
LRGANRIGRHVSNWRTPIGDTVNAAAHIEAENKHLGSEVLLGTQTPALLSDDERVQLAVSAEHEPVLVKGKSQPLDVYRFDVP